MNSYPHEVGDNTTSIETDTQFLAHPKPLMFVAGLSAAAPKPTPAAPAEESKSETGANEDINEAQPESKSSPTQPEGVDEFEQLKTDCRAAFEPFGRKVDVWAEKEGKERRFRILRVEKVCLHIAPD